MRKIRTGALTMACAALSAATACGSSDDTQADGQGATSTPKSSSSASKSSSSSASSGASARRLAQARRAVRTAERKVRRGDAYDIESDRLRGERVWEVKVARGTARPYELDVRADGRRVVRQRRRQKVDDDVREVARAKVSLDQALMTAGTRAEGGRFDEAEIDRARGKVVWEATFKRSGDREVEIRIDARSGDVLAVATDD